VAQFAILAIWPEVMAQLVPRVMSLIIGAVLDWVSLAVSVRRMHDLGKSGWLLALSIVPVAGVIMLIWSFGRPGMPGPNRFGLGSRASA
jgi:uncharacterized membrane protein YhaH (DUF805 family)